MAFQIALEAALAPFIFFGCEVAALDHNTMQRASDVGSSECVVAQPLAAIDRLNTARLGACSITGQSASKQPVNSPIGSPHIGDLPGGNLGGVFTGSQPGGAINPAPPGVNAPAVTLIANPSTIQTGQTAMLVWEGRNVDRCVGGGGWSGERNTTGTESTTTLSDDTTYTLRCDGPNGQIVGSVVVNVFNPNPPPTLSFSANPATIDGGTASTLSWSASNADFCVASGGWSGMQTLVGSQSTGALNETSTYTLACAGSGGWVSDTLVVTVDGAPAPPAVFAKNSIDTDRAPWGKNLADVDGDGELDILTGGGLLGSDVYWYRSPNWERFQIGSVGGGDDLQAGDINGDGAIDIVVNRDPIAWYENPVGSGGNVEDPWLAHTIVPYRSHDIALVDMNSDNKLDVVVRFAGVTFGTTRVFLQGATPDTWTTVILSNDSNGTGGLKVADIDDDGKPDVLGDGYWLRQPDGDITVGGDWQRYPIGDWPAGSSIDAADLNGDGNIDVTLAVSEVGVGEFSWFEAPDDPLTQPWIRHVIDSSVEDVHRHHLVDLNNDGQLDILFAEMFQSQTDRVGVYYNDGNAESWTLDILETHASHNLAIGDIGNDGDIDFLGSNWQLNAPAGGDIFLWINESN
ncbi:MAG: FG-GAP-like repeat-containing protein [Pseudomonadota bacterium]